jgi:hypothetical protein
MTGNGESLRGLPVPRLGYVLAMSRPKQFEHFRYVGDKRNQRVHDLDNATDACKIDELMKAETFLAFGPDTLVEASNRCYKPCSHCVREDAA